MFDTQAHKWLVHHTEDAHLLVDLELGPRTEWGAEILEVIDEGDQVRVGAGRAGCPRSNAR